MKLWARYCILILKGSKKAFLLLKRFNKEDSNNMDRAVDRWIDEHKNELIDALSANLKIASLKDTDAAAEGAPFGPMIRRALDTALDCGRSLGFETVDYDGYCGAIDMPAGEEQLGIICHLDVVPEGSGWTYPPYGAEIHDGKLYARGTMDDKGPAYAALFAMKAVKECKIPLKRSVRLILGCDEESGMSCLKHYNRVAKAPTLSFSPDAEYPVVNSEKMIFRTEYKKEFKSGITIKAGTRRNVVPGEAVATVPMALSRIVPIMEAFMEGSEFACSAEAIDENSTRIIMKGLAAHASAPEHGKNAMLAMLALLDKLPLEGEDAATVAALTNALKFDCHGETLGIDNEDASGRLTLNPGVLDWDGDGIHRLTFDVRAPISSKAGELERKITLGLKDTGLVQTDISWSEGYYISPDDELVKKLLDVYEGRFGRRLEPLAIGGGTYARHMKNSVAFGIERPGEPGRAHMPDEFIPIDDLIEDTKVLADAIIALAGDNE